jgi:hypothetical protein
MTHIDRRSLRSVALVGSARLNVWALMAATSLFVVWLWAGALQGALHDERGLGLLLPMLLGPVCGLFLLLGTGLGWSGLQRVEKVAGLAIGLLGIANPWLVAFAVA